MHKCSISVMPKTETKRCLYTLEFRDKNDVGGDRMHARVQYIPTATLARQIL